MKKYHPNFKDKRVAERVRKAIGFSKAVISENKPHAWSTRYIDRYFGQQQHDLSKYLRSVLLIVTNNHWSVDGKKCKEYMLNGQGYTFLRDSLDGKTSLTWAEYRKQINSTEERTEEEKTAACITSLINPDDVYDREIVNEWCRREFACELQNLAFTYEDKSGRLWHPLQKVKREIKKEVLSEAGLVHQYDIDCCAPTLLYQYALQVGMDEYLEYIAEYLNNKTKIREQLAEDAELPVKAVKVIINSLFAGAKIGSSPAVAMGTVIGHDQARAEYLRQDKFIVGLRKDIKTMWEYIEEHHGCRYKADSKGNVLLTKKGKPKKVPMTSSRKWSIYFDLERRVLDCVREYLEKTNTPNFLEHDGWTTASQIDCEALYSYVKSKTGFDVRFSYEEVKPE